MTADEYQVRAHSFADYPGVGHSAVLYPDSIRYPVYGLAEEAGEAVGKFAKAVRDDGDGITEGRRLAIAKELGDVLWMVAEIGTRLNLPLGWLMEKNIEKLESRAARGKIHGSGDDR